MIYVRGDTHGEILEFSDRLMPGQSQWTQEDILIVAGDFGYLMHPPGQSATQDYNLEVLSQKPYQILFVDGNHEGFPCLQACPEEIRFGGPVRRIRDNIFWLQRGYIYNIQGSTVFVMGGAYSMDKAWRLSYGQISGETIWFPEELPSAQEYRRAIANLEGCGKKVDYIITHTAPRSIIPRVIHTMPDPNDAELTGFLDWVYHDVEFSQWYFGHFHMDERINDQITACLRQVHILGE